jgi:hypothetical protein
MVGWFNSIKNTHSCAFPKQDPWEMTFWDKINLEVGWCLASLVEHQALSLEIGR